MANTYTKLFFHVVFAVKGRSNLISPVWKEELYKYISGTVDGKGQFLIAINGMPDHVHVLLGLKADVHLSEVIRDIKANSSRFINEKKWVQGKFEWQNGFGGFTVGYSQLNTVAGYIKKQEEHHSKKTFWEEYLEFLTEHDIDFNTEYLFKEI